MEDSSSMTVAEFLELAKENPLMTESAHARVYRRVFVEPGWETVCVGDLDDDGQLMRALQLPPKERIRLFNAFLDMEGRELELELLAKYFEAALKGDEQLKQMLILLGGTGTAKSTIVARFHQLLEGAPIWALDGCPMHEHPFRLLPRKDRRDASERYGVVIPLQADICGMCRLRLYGEFSKLKTGDMWQEFPVIEKKISARLNTGAAIIFPVDKLSADLGIMNGRENIAMLDSKEFKMGDPRTLLYNGGFHRAEQGVAEFREIFKFFANDDMRNNLIFATQEKEIPGPGGHERVSLDSVIIGHSNRSEFSLFLSDTTNEALDSRMEIVYFPHLLRWSAEARAYKRVRNHSLYKDAHVSPQLYEIAAKYAVATRIATAPDIGLLNALAVYDGDVATKTPKDLRIASKDNGWVGLDLRFLLKAIGAVYAHESRFITLKDTCVIWPELRDELEARVSSMKFDEQEQGKYRELLTKADEWFVFALRDSFLDATIGAQAEDANNFFRNYVEHARQWLLKKQANAPSEDLAVHDSFLREVEEAMGVSPQIAFGFRETVVSLVDDAVSEGLSFNWWEHDDINRGVRRRLVARLRDLVLIPSSSISENDTEARALGAALVAQLVEKHGYCATCARKTIDFVAAHTDQVLQV